MLATCIVRETSNEDNNLHGRSWQETRYSRPELTEMVFARSIIYCRLYHSIDGPVLLNHLFKLIFLHRFYSLCKMLNFLLMLERTWKEGTVSECAADNRLADFKRLYDMIKYLS